MSAVSSTCAPCAATPVTVQPTVVGGGGATAAPEPTPIASCMPNGPAATCFSPAPVPVAAPAASPYAAYVPPTTVAGGPPEPMALPAGAPAPTTPLPGQPAPSTIGAGASAPQLASGSAARSLATWTEWETAFRQLGLSDAAIAKIAAAELTNEGLAGVYEQLALTGAGSGSTPSDVPGAADPDAVPVGTDPNAAAVPADPNATGQAGTNAWSPQWEQKFAALGMAPEAIAEFAKQAQQIGATDQEIQGLYDSVAAQAGGKGPAAAQTPAWTPEVEQKFRSLGLPDELLKVYAQALSQTPGPGAADAALKHVQTRLADFKDRGWLDKFTAEKTPALGMWQLILADEPKSDKDLQKLVEQQHRTQMPLPLKALQTGISLFPGGRLVEYIAGRKIGGTIDQTDPGEIAMAALSGVSAVLAVRGGMQVARGLAAAKGGYAAIGKAAASGSGGAAQSVVGVGELTLGKKLAAFIPFTKTHREIVGMGQVELAAKSFGENAAKLKIGDADGALQQLALKRGFQDIANGQKVLGGGNAYFPQLRKAVAPMSFGPSKSGEVLKVAKSLWMPKAGAVGAGDAQLAAFMQATGNKIGSNPSWLGVAGLGDLMRSQSSAELSQFGDRMAANAVRDLGVDGKGKAAKYLRNLAAASYKGEGGALTNDPAWYTKLTKQADVLVAKHLGATAATEATEASIRASGALSIFTGVLDEAKIGLKAVDPARLADPKVRQLTDDAVGALEQLHTATAQAHARGMGMDDLALLDNFERAQVALGSEAPDVAKLVFGRLDDAALVALRDKGEAAARAALPGVASAAPAGAAGSSAVAAAATAAP